MASKKEEVKALPACPVAPIEDHLASDPALLFDCAGPMLIERDESSSKKDDNWEEPFMLTADVSIDTLLDEMFINDQLLLA